MRWLSLAGAMLFAYLAIVPAALVISTFDSACAGGDCETPFAQDALLVALYTACFAGIAGSSALLSLYFFQPTVRGERLIRRALVGAVAAVGTTLFALFALTFPFPALFTLGVGGVVYGVLRYLNAPQEPEPPPPSQSPSLPSPEQSSNGHGKLNGHPG